MSTQTLSDAVSLKFSLPIINQTQDFATTKKAVVSSLKMTQLKGSERPFKIVSRKNNSNKKCFGKTSIKLATHHLNSRPTSATN